MTEIAIKKMEKYFKKKPEAFLLQAKKACFYFMWVFQYALICSFILIGKGT